MSILEVNARNARMLSMLGQRGSIFGVALPDIAQTNENIKVLTADLGLLSGLGKFIAAHPDKYLNVGIAEQNMLGIASGLAKEGNCVFVTTYATFVTMRSFEQIRNNLGYMKFNVKVIGSSGGLAMGMSGNEHYALEDISLMRSVPNMTVLSPADGVEALKMAYAIAEINGPVYLRLTGGLNCPMVYKEDYQFEIGKAVKLREGSDVAVIATGTMVNEALKAADLLEHEGISACVINMHTIKPLDGEMLNTLYEKFPFIVTVEEHSKIGGLGSAVAEHKTCVKNAPAHLILALPDMFGMVAEQGFLLDKYGLNSMGIAKSIKNFIE
ncbi:MAG: transketolase C-terminal domain-containing protein [Oscillospiraceae bacterium]